MYKKKNIIITLKPGICQLYAEKIRFSIQYSTVYQLDNSLRKSYPIYGLTAHFQPNIFIMVTIYLVALPNNINRGDYLPSKIYCLIWLVCRGGYLLLPNRE
jgi:hypothetical protein